MRKQWTMRKGFTLIELLIVIAIIAILALIAVPNFLESQVRAKVSRLHSDMRTVATAVEAYSVDWGRPPIGRNEGRNMGLWREQSPQANAASYSFMTTPVAYLTSKPHDPFAIHGVTKGFNGYREPEPFFEYKTARGSWRSDIQPPSTSAHWNVTANGYSWWTHSAGPAMGMHSPWAWQMFAKLRTPTNVYDTTNGTMSTGQIIRSNKGVYTGNND